MWKTKLGVRDHTGAFSEIRQHWKSRSGQGRRTNHKFLGNHVDIPEHNDFENNLDLADIPEHIDFEFDFEHKRH